MSNESAILLTLLLLTVVPYMLGKLVVREHYSLVETWLLGILAEIFTLPDSNKQYPEQNWKNTRRNI